MRLRLHCRPRLQRRGRNSHRDDSRHPWTWKFDPKPFDGHAVVLFLDSTATALPIDKNGDVILNGMNLFDPRQPFWRGKAPDIKWPE